MLEDEVRTHDAETEFRHRLAAKLRQRGCPEDEVQARIDLLLRKGTRLQLDVPAILNG